MQEQKKSIVITAHRGCSGLEPENSIPSILKGLAYGVDRIEIDIHQTKDNVLIAIHDKTINRTTSGKGVIKNLTYGKIIQFPLKTNIKSDSNEIIIPTVEQIIKIISGKSTLLIEIKHGANVYPNIEERLVEMIQKYNANKWCIIQSFDIEILEKIHMLNGELELHLLCICKIPMIPLWICKKIEFDILRHSFLKEISVCKSFINKRLVKTIHKKKYRINAWTVNNSKEAKNLIDLGVDGIITDYPYIVNNQF